MVEFRREYNAALAQALRRLNWNYGRGEYIGANSPDANGRGTWKRQPFRGEPEIRKYKVITNPELRKMIVYACGHQITIGV